MDFFKQQFLTCPLTWGYQDENLNLVKEQYTVAQVKLPLYILVAKAKQNKTVYAVFT
jgi:hypothetical protein